MTENLGERHLGSDLDDFLREEGLLEEVEAVAAKRVLAHRVAEAMNGQADAGPFSQHRQLTPEIPSESPLRTARAGAKRARIEDVDAEGR